MRGNPDERRKMDSGFLRNDGSGQFRARRYFSTTPPWPELTLKGVLKSPPRGNNPPYPPLSGSKPTEEGGFASRCVSRQWLLQTLVPHSRLTLTRGGRGGCLYPLRDFFIGHSPRDARPLKGRSEKKPISTNKSSTEIYITESIIQEPKTSLENAGSFRIRKVRSGRFVTRDGIIPPSHRTRSPIWNARRTRRFRPGAENRARR